MLKFKITFFKEILMFISFAIYLFLNTFFFVNLNFLNKSISLFIFINEVDRFLLFLLLVFFKKTFEF